MKQNELRKAFELVWSRHRRWVLCTALISLLLGLVPAAHLWVVKELVEEVSGLIANQSMEYSAAFQLLVLQFLVLLFSSVLGKGQELYDKHTEMRLDHDLQRTVLTKTSEVPLEMFDRPGFHHAIERVYSGQGPRFLLPIKTTMELMRHLTTLASFLIYLFSVHWSLALVSMSAAFPMLWVLSKFGSQRFRLQYYQTPSAREAGYLKFLLSDRQAAKEVRLYRLRGFLLGSWSDRFLQNAGEYFSLYRREKGAIIALDGLTAFLYAASAGLIIWLARTASITIGDFVALGQAVQGSQNSINQIAALLARVYETRLYIRDYFRFMDEEEFAARVERGERTFPTPLAEGISVEGISFSYPDSDRLALHDVSLTIKTGERIAIVGENGSGKTTLVNCLIGLYQVQQGSIRIDGLPLQDFSEQELYRNMTVIFQDFMRYDFTVRDNIVLGHLEAAADQERLENAAERSGVHRIVSRFASGYDTHLGRSYQEGEDLSGGQWQKIALARALYSDGQILILDEPTAALDPHAEMEVFRQFDHLTREKTAIFISHRMAAARMADRIVVMKDGQVCEMGTHEQLMALEGEYCRMYTVQAKWYR